MNFAEAALLIQGSTCVYSKKVDQDIIHTICSIGTFFIPG